MIPSRSIRAFLLPGLALAALASPALAHVSAEPAQAPAGSYQVIRLRIGHGCDGKATTGLKVELPPALGSARPQPKPGWTLRIEREGEQVTAIAWAGDLPADQFDEFAILVKLPAQPGPLHLPTTQACGADEAQWTEIPDPGDGKLSHPAPTILVTPAQGAAETHHH